MLNFSFLGDISLNGNYIEQYKRNENPFGSLKDVFAGKDFVVGNLECIAKGDFGENLAKKPRLTTTVDTLNYLHTIPVNIVSLAQNHIYDHLEDGFNKTSQFLEDNNIKYIGASKNKETAAHPLILDKNGIKIGLLNFVSEDTNPSIPLDANVYVNIFSIENAIGSIQILKKQVNHVVVLLHWGGRVEGGLYPDFNQPQIARQLIDAGADLIIGHHSHTIQPFEQYKNKYIFYSLGNFCFSDYVFENKFNPISKRQNISSILNIKFTKTVYEIDLQIFKNEKSRFKLTNYKNKLRFRNCIFQLIRMNYILWRFYFFHKSYILPFIIFIQRRDITFFGKIRRIVDSVWKKARKALKT
ncbi:MAG: CapA family protein [Salinivirgaceae bacterium]|nr:CapA family protein [Salinivirgaceae bacterium]